ncbi:anaerobic sulfite reductase subunit AsrA [Tissierella sp. MSJ-40]|uniref:Anaerobic sulfite reductase subunit AsrA n=1 Tax=Tissierella simiarum TaxID=2841534 RepID=A0ABS6E104_9FIRM|nr:anaerobic sulfite reductase subunit AsrA [Tissierella simiarum]MBU5436577.1 anaerobic sulfite reductase subunit AsrA [Tissierella simiarum]
MSYEITNIKFNSYLEKWSRDYEIYGPVKISAGGRFSDTDNIRYEKIKKVEDIEYKEKSIFSAKEVLFPVTETLFNIQEEQLNEPVYDKKKYLVFLRACDIHAIDRIDYIFLKNGIYTDPYYKRRREAIKYILIGCKESFENCFCASMGTNKTDNYSMGIKFFDDKVHIEAKDPIFQEEFKEEIEIEFTPDYVLENYYNVTIPSVEKLDFSLFNDEMWKDYAMRCISCGRCNFSCPTCSCFTTSDIYYKENPNNGERRRVWAGCQVDKFTDMAGGHSFRTDYGSRMRFKTMHKVYDFKKRFGEIMCVGCGRCDDRCPEYISFARCINLVSEKVNEDHEEVK